MPNISVLMSVYNGERWVSESIQSILNQTFSDFEFIIVDDGSRDRSAEIIQWFAVRDSRIRVFHKINTGLADSLNFGIKRARGEWIARIDADDKSEPLRLAKQIELIRSDHEMVLIGTGLKLVDQYGSDRGIYDYSTQHDKLLRRLIFNMPFFAHSSAMYKTKLALEIGGYRARIHRAEDHDLWLRLSQHGKLGCVDSPLVAIRKHDNQISHDDYGRRQLIDSNVARVSYWLRQMGCEDPVEVLTDSKFFEFHSWVEDEMENAGVFKMLDHIQALKKQVELKNNFFNKLIFLSMSVIDSPVIFTSWFRNKVFGSSLPRALSKKWIDKVY